MYKLPIFSAMKMDSDEEVVGVAYEDKKEKCIYISNDAQNLYTSAFKIEKSTLKISFDDGKSFIKLSDLEMLTCTDFELKYTDMKMRDKKLSQPSNGSIFTLITDKGR